MGIEQLKLTCLDKTKCVLDQFRAKTAVLVKTFFNGAVICSLRRGPQEL